jgi:hypothetical protein
VKVDKNPERKIQEAEMRKQLRLIDGMQSIFALEFHGDFVIDDYVRAESTLESHVFIDQRDGLLAFYVVS